MLVNDENDEKDSVTRTRASTLLPEQQNETSIFSDTQTNVLETEDTNEMIITVGNLSAGDEKNIRLEFPVDAAAEVGMKNATEGISPFPPNEAENTESVLPSA